MGGYAFPQGNRFAFSVIDDTDVATVENIRPVYRLLSRLKICATKTVWPVSCPEGSKNFSRSKTLEDPEYLAFVKALQAEGFEITWHGATMESSKRDRTLRGLERYREEFGSYPRIHANHGTNRENVYWGLGRIDDKLLRVLVRGATRVNDGYFQGHVRASPYWWGDLCAEHITYARNLTFNSINTAKVNPSMPYHDPNRPLVKWWFSATDAEDASAFRDLLTDANMDRLEKEGGICIVSTHFGKGFAENGEVGAAIRGRLEALAARPGWFPSVGELLGWMRQQGGSDELPSREWRRMQWQWAWDLWMRKWRARRNKRS